MLLIGVVATSLVACSEDSPTNPRALLAEIRAVTAEDGEHVRVSCSLTFRPGARYNDHMVIQMTATEVKRRILSLLDQVAEGDEIEITKHGRTVAKLVPATGPAVAAGALEGIASSDPDDDLLSTGLDWKLP